ncbi:MAG: quinoprotein dehydrogenase-associated putative ABC transporter substrate-binding protein [Rhodospirillales bacterium]|nr:quinoprotein dehydrogenase-associated putative ABC transporter substrate-binding protein [Rhodospirillales bacterium]
MIASVISPAFRGILFALLIFSVSGLSPIPAARAADTVERPALRVCADPANLPFSSRSGEGFENKVAALFGEKLGLPVTYAWFPQTIGFIRNTLKAKKCDLILGAVADQEPLLSTAPYYRSAYALVYRADSDIAGIDTLSDTRLKNKSIGIVAGTPPATIMATNGLLEHSKSFPLAVDRRHAAPAERMIAEIAAGELDAGILWGPIAGYYAQQNGGGLLVVPLLKETTGPQMIFAITMGVRHGKTKWQHTVNNLIARHQDEIDAVLRGFAVPLVKLR